MFLKYLTLFYILCTGCAVWDNFRLMDDYIFSMVRFLKIAKGAPKVMHSFWQINGLGYTLGDFFPNLSGRPYYLILFRTCARC
jgi:hypothetical protein